MRAGYLRVFDGLRLTTEHLEHLQSAVHLAVRDLRDILGLGKIYSGFQVERAGESSVLVRPGLAFDFQRNQIVSDEPKTIQISFGDSQDLLYLCISYDQVTTDAVENKPTMVWDACKFVMRADIPSPKDNQISIARLRRRTDQPNAFDLLGAEELAGPMSPSEPSINGDERPGGLATTSVGPTVGMLKFSGRLGRKQLLEEMSAPPANSGADGHTEPGILLAEGSLPGSLTSVDVIMGGEIKLPAAATPDGLALSAQSLSFQVTAHAEIAPDAAGLVSVFDTQLVARTASGERFQLASAASDDAILSFAFTCIRQSGVFALDAPSLDVFDGIILRVKVGERDSRGSKLQCLASWTSRSPTPLSGPEFDISWNLNAVWRIANLPRPEPTNRPIPQVT